MLGLKYIRRRWRKWRESRTQVFKENAILKKMLRKGAIKARYEAAQTTDENSAHWTYVDDYSPILSLTPSVRKKIRQRARYEARENNSYANGIVNTIADEILGKGPVVNFPELKLKESIQIQRAWRQWCDDNRIHDKVRRMVVAEYIEGESIALLVTEEGNDNPVGLGMRVYEPDYLEPKWLDSIDHEDAIKFDNNGNPSEYHILYEHPGGGSNTGAGQWYPAEQVLHLFRQERAGQVRGVSRLAPCLNLFTLLRRFTLATVEAAETAASFAAILHSDPNPNAVEEDGLGEDDWFSAIPTIHRALMTIPRGWHAEQMKSEHPASTYADFKRELLNEICRCLGVPLNIALANSSGYNYASGRLDHLTFYRMVGVEQKRYELEIYDRLFYEWYKEAWLLGDGTVPKASSKSPDKLHWVWVWDRGRNADPLKEAMADIELVNHRMKTLADYYAEKGKNWEEEIMQIGREQKLMLQEGVTPEMISPSSQDSSPADDEDPPTQSKSSMDRQAAWNSARRRAYQEIYSQAIADEAS